MYSSTDSERVNGNSNSHFSVYKSLNQYNRVKPGDVNGPKIPCRIPSMGTQIVPQYHNQMGYHALTHNMAPEQMNTGHYTVRSAYPNYLRNCDTFQARGCDKMVQKMKKMSMQPGMVVDETEIMMQPGMTGMMVDETEIMMQQGMTGMMVDETEIMMQQGMTGPIERYSSCGSKNKNSRRYM